MRVELDVTPPNSLVLIGAANGDVPTEFGDQLVVATSSCIAIGTRSEQDASTSVIIASDRADVDGALDLVHRGQLELQDGFVRVFDALDETIWSGVVDPHRVVEVWADDPIEPDRIVVVFAN